MAAALSQSNYHSSDQKVISPKEVVLPSDPYAVYCTLEEILSSSGTTSAAELLSALSQAFSRLAELNDFPGIVRLFDRYRSFAPPLDALPHDGPVFNFLFKGANAKIRCGGVAEAVEILQAIIARKPKMLSPRWLLASVVRNEDLRLALSYLLAVRHHASFAASRPAVLSYIDLLAANQLTAMARAEARALQTVALAGELKLAMANLEQRAPDKLALFNEFLALEGVASLVLAPGAEALSLETLEVQPLEADQEGPLVSILMTTFNSAQYAHTAIRSIQAQTYRHWELWIVDDKSSDETPRILREFEQADPRIHVLLKTDNSGTYVSKNLALAQCRGEFVTCHDSDDFSHPEKLERQVEQLLQNPDLLANVARWVRVDEKGDFLLKRWGVYTHDNPASLMFRRSFVLENLGFFDSVRVGADTEFRQRIGACYGWDAIGNIETVTALGRHHSASLTQSGAGAIDEHGISPARQIYTGCWLDWHARNLARKDRLSRTLSVEERRYRAPASIAPDPEARLADKIATDDRYARFDALPAPSAISFKGSGETAEIVHAADLTADDLMASVMLSHVAAERAGGLPSVVWNVVEVDADAFSWQGSHLRQLAARAIIWRLPAAPKLLFVYGAQMLASAAHAAGDRPPAGSVIVLTRTQAEFNEAGAILQKLGWHGTIYPLNNRLFGGRLDGERDLHWNGALYPGLFDRGESPTLERADRLGLSFVGRSVTDEDLAFIQRLQAETALPVTVLAEDADLDKLAKVGADTCPADRSRNFWDDFFARCSVLVDREDLVESTTLFEAVGQALMRLRLVALISGGALPAPGARVFETEGQLLDFLAALARDPSAFCAARQKAEAELRAALGDGFHLARMRRLLEDAEICGLPTEGLRFDFNSNMRTRDASSNDRSRLRRPRFRHLLRRFRP